MKKLLLLLSVTTALVFSYTISAKAASENVQRPIHININGKFIQTDANPEQIHNRILVPIRALSSLGLEYNWNSSTKTVSITNTNKSTVKITLNSKTASINDKPTTLDVPAQMRHGRIYVPIRFVTEAFGAQVQLETIRQILFISSENNYSTQRDITGEDLKAERQAAISLPIQANFKLINSPQESYVGETYSFPAGKADEYIYSDGRTATLVKIKDGKAVAIGQYRYGALADFAKVAGDIKGNTDAILRPYRTNPTGFKRDESNQITAYYVDGKGNNIELKEGISKRYDDIIVAIPDQK